jgi:hypothetical protein
VANHGLTAEEDAHLRRLHYFEQVGAVLSPVFRELKGDYLARDRRNFVRAPTEEVSFTAWPTAYDQPELDQPSADGQASRTGLTAAQVAALDLLPPSRTDGVDRLPGR